MARARRLKQGEENTDINISPMIDMVFILLIFFIVTTVFVDEIGLDQIDRPQPGADRPNDPDNKPVAIRINKNGQIFVNNQEVGLSGVRTRVAERLTRNPDLPVIVEAEKTSRSGLFVQVADEAKIAGATRISLKSYDAE